MVKSQISEKTRVLPSLRFCFAVYFENIFVVIEMSEFFVFKIRANENNFSFPGNKLPQRLTIVEKNKLFIRTFFSESKLVCT